MLRKNISVELNLEMAAVDEMINIALKVRPDIVTLVPEKRKELTTEGGLDLRKNITSIKKAVDIIQGDRIPVSLFINPSVTDVIASRRAGARMVEIHTGRYSDTGGNKKTEEFKRVKKTIKKAIDIGLLVNAGHGLNYLNVGKIAAIKGIRGLYIGHSIISMSVFTGIEEAVREMRRIIRKAVSKR
jgi:pyridoxine 5-phosphate synthase